MIITRSPLRISLGGGGTDLPSYYREHGGFLVAAAIDKYIYINIQRRFVDGFLLKYSQLEEAATIEFGIRVERNPCPNIARAFVLCASVSLV